MKNFKKTLCILTAVAMLFTMTGLGVFAAEDVENPAEDQVVETQVAEDQAVIEEDGVVELQENDAAEPAEVTVQQEETKIIPGQPTVTALSGFHSIKLKWDATENAEAYNVGIQNDDGSWGWLGTTTKNVLEIEKKGLKQRKTYHFRVFAAVLNDDAKDKTELTYKDIKGYKAGSNWSEAWISPMTYVDKQIVNKMHIAVTLKKTRKYGGVRMKAGTRVVTDGYAAGNYYFDNPKGKRAYVARIAARNAKADYKPKSKYELDEATYFINRYMENNKKLNPKNGRVIWVSTYTQHLYMFKKEGGKWVSLNGYNWPVSMGKASTPSPTGNKVIGKRISARHGIKFWSCYSGLNALHGVKGNWGKKLGKLASHGCIRNPKDGAQKIWKNCKKGTRVIVY
ncbi:MAG: L,D-transpeptidase family protein [Firmicutes bacterium]|nr:L,D-transpeptidase family protein [Bacillota bacterium]